MSWGVVRIPLKGLVPDSTLFSCRCSIIERHFQHDELHHDHERCLYEEGFVVISAEPVEHPECENPSQSQDS